MPNIFKLVFAVWIFAFTVSMISPFILELNTMRQDALSPEQVEPLTKSKLQKDCKRVAVISERNLDWYDRKKLKECENKGVLNESSVYDPFF